MKKVFVVGGGFGGLAAARNLSRSKQLQVTLLDRRNYHLFQPLLYQVAMAGLSPAEIAVPLRSLFSNHNNTQILMANVESINLGDRKVISDIGSFDYDYLLLACGAKHSYFGHEEWEENAPGLKTVEQATEIRRRVFMAFERAEAAQGEVVREHWLTFVVVGGGPTGVELAGALGEISRFSLSQDFHHIDPKNTKIILVEAGDRILPSFDPSLSLKAASALKDLGVDVRTNCRVTSVTKDGVFLGEEFIAAKTVVWAAGVEAASINQLLPEPKDHLGRLIIDDTLTLDGHPEVFVIGDQVALKGTDGQLLPGIAPVAVQQGEQVARNILADLKGKERRPFSYVDRGQMATIGRRSAVVQIGRIKLSGAFAWLLWLAVHIFFLIGFRNKIFVFLQWVWHYMTYRRGARLIVHKEWKSYPKKA